MSAVMRVSNLASEVKMTTNLVAVNSAKLFNMVQQTILLCYFVTSLGCNAVCALPVASGAIKLTC